MNEIEEARKKLKELDIKVDVLRKEVKNGELTKLQAAIKKRESEVEVLEAKLEEPLVTECKTKAEKKIKKHISLPKISITPRARKIVASAIVICMVTMMFTVFVTRVTAAAPAVNFADPDDEGTFADTNDGDGANWCVNVTDANTDLAWVKLYANDSGDWVLFYDSGALGGVAYHNASGQNGNWTGSWTMYWYNISANDGTTYNATYSFTTAYQWGDVQMVYLDDTKQYSSSVMLKNASSDYYLWALNPILQNNQIMEKTSNSGTNWSLESASYVTSLLPVYLFNSFTYNNQPSVFYAKHNNNLFRAFLNWSSGNWENDDTSLQQVSGDAEGWGADIVYYDGKWQLITGLVARMRHYYGTFPDDWTLVSEIVPVDGSVTRKYFPSVAVVNGVLHLVYRNHGEDLQWQTYDGVAWTDHGNIGGDTLDLTGDAHCSMLKDPVNNQLACVYIDTSGDLRYRVTDNTTSWSDSSLILSKGAYDIRYPHVEFMDSRLVITFSYNLRGNYNIYTISAPDYSGRISGFNTVYNRIQFPDANPDDTNVNSTVFSLKNIDNRSIFTIMWHFEDIGEIANASNFEVWTNMSGAWTSIGTTDAGGDVATLDISGLMAGGGEWIVGQKTWWKVEILAVGSVSEDIHTTDEDIYYKVTFA